MDKPQVLEHIHHSVNYTLFDALWVPSSARCVILGQHARGTGALEVLNMSQQKLVPVKSTTKKSGFKCGTFAHSTLEERQLATGSFDGSLNIWDLERLELPCYSAHKHTQIVNCIDGCGGLVGSGAPEIVTGSRDGSVKVWDPRQPDDPVCDMAPEEGEHARDCWSVAFGNAVGEERCVVAGYDNGDVKLFDLRAMKLRWETTLPNGVCSVEFDRKDISMNKLLVTCLESRIHVFDTRTLHTEEGFASVTEKSHKSTVWVGRHLPQNRDVFITGGGNGSLNVWKYSYPKARKEVDESGVERGVAGTLSLINSAVVSSQPIGSLQWHRDMRGLCITTSFDQTVRVCLVTNLNLI